MTCIQYAASITAYYVRFPFYLSRALCVSFSLSLVLDGLAGTRTFHQAFSAASLLPSDRCLSDSPGGLTRHSVERRIENARRTSVDR